MHQENDNQVNNSGSNAQEIAAVLVPANSQLAENSQENSQQQQNPVQPQQHRVAQIVEVKFVANQQRQQQSQFFVQFACACCLGKDTWLTKQDLIRDYNVDEARLRILEEQAIKELKERETRKHADELMKFLFFDDVEDFKKVNESDFEEINFYPIDDFSDEEQEEEHQDQETENISDYLSEDSFNQRGSKKDRRSSKHHQHRESKSAAQSQHEEHLSELADEVEDYLNNLEDIAGEINFCSSQNYTSCVPTSSRRASRNHNQELIQTRRRPASEYHPLLRKRDQKRAIKALSHDQISDDDDEPNSNYNQQEDEKELLDEVQKTLEEIQNQEIRSSLQDNKGYSSNSFLFGSSSKPKITKLTPNVKGEVGSLFSNTITQSSGRINRSKATNNGSKSKSSAVLGKRSKIGFDLQSADQQSPSQTSMVAQRTRAGQKNHQSKQNIQQAKCQSQSTTATGLSKLQLSTSGIISNLEDKSLNRKNKRKQVVARRNC